MWKLRDCWMRAARAKCTKVQAEQVFNLPKLFMPGMAEECREYTQESGKCTVPMWLIASVVSAGLFILGTCLCGTVYCFMRVRKRKSRRRRHSHPHRSGGRSRSTSGTSTQTTQLIAAHQNGPKVGANGGPHLNGSSKKAPPPGLPMGQKPFMDGSCTDGGKGAVSTSNRSGVTIQIDKPVEPSEECKALTTGADGSDLNV